MRTDRGAASSGRSRAGRSAGPGSRSSSRRDSLSRPAERSIDPWTSTTSGASGRRPPRDQMARRHAPHDPQHVGGRAARAVGRAGEHQHDVAVRDAAVRATAVSTANHTISSVESCTPRPAASPRPTTASARRPCAGPATAPTSRRSRPEAGHRPGRAPAAGAAQDRRRAGVVGGLPGGVGDRLGDPVGAVGRTVRCSCPRRCGPLPVARLGLGPRGDARHRRRRPRTGSSPIAVSPDSITASVPSNTALATSLTSARVGAGASIIVSSICVAVITGVPTSTQWRMICFCRCGTSSSGQSMPRSPRATITASAAAVISASSPSAAAVSILATMPARSPTTARSASTSAARRDERQRDVVDAGRGDGLGELEVLGGRGDMPQPLARQVHAGAALRAAAALDLGEHRRSTSSTAHAQRDGAVAEHDAVAGVEVVEQRRVVDGRPVRGARPAARARVATGSPASEVDAAVGERPGADLRPGQVGEHADRAPEPWPPTLADRRQALRGARRSCRG